MKYYYTDALASAWMAKHFGMKFVGYGRLDLKHEIPLAAHFAGGLLPDDAKFYIHPDSLHLLEPHIGDVCRTNKKLDTGFDDVILIEDKSELNVYNDVDGFRIIQRNGLSFMWPEHE